jgi:hypothetical protein
LKMLVFFGSHFPSRQAFPLGLKMLVFWIAFSESPSVSAWLENAQRLPPPRIPPSPRKTS